MWEPSTDFSYGFASGISFFLIIEIIRCIRTSCCHRNNTPSTNINHNQTLPSIITPQYNLPASVPPVFARTR
jgi:hypothetical protein